MNKRPDNLPEHAATGNPPAGTPGRGEIILYQTDDGRTRVECRFEGETIWMSQAFMAELFNTTKQNISLHLKNIFKEGELLEDQVVKEYLTTAADHKSYRTKHFSLDAILAVGYRVRSLRGTQFRRWATERLREYLVKGFTIDDRRLKNPPVPELGVPDYFDDLLARIRDIRASEQRMYLRVKEIFAMAADYQPSADQTALFFQVIQNKLHFATTGLTAAELIARRADHQQPNMGLTTWKGGEVRKADVTIAKNYLQAGEIEELNRIVVMWLDFAEDQARRRKQVFMTDWEKKLDEFLVFNERMVLPNAGKVPKYIADDFAKQEYEQFSLRRREFKEIHGEEAAFKELEQVANELPVPAKPTNDPGED